eukprot:TRINITY_DN19304_c0_g1_i3.p1 TRINITY_DN19304_c0_g1~~TRINITY_DN19304_c0_g1_i3.p1  ORF type:complete len:429 (+),score=107.23 TRINITY_DN19304_c0_g1_i3:1-1287(+)
MSCHKYDVQVSKKFIAFLAPLRQKIVGLDIFSSSKMLSLRLPNLEKLKLVVHPEVKVASEQMVKKYAPTLKQLNIVLAKKLYYAFDVKGITAPKLESLQTGSLSPAMLEFARNVTKLVLGFQCAVSMPKGKRLKCYSLPNLKELFLGLGFDPKIAQMLIESNADHLETLNLFTRDIDCELELDPNIRLPKLTTYVEHSIDCPIIPQILEASSNSLERLVILTKDSDIFSGDVNYGEDILLPKLTDIIVPLTPWSKDLIELNQESIEMMVLELTEHDDDISFLYDDDRKGTPKTLHFTDLADILELQLPALEKLVVLDGLEYFDDDMFDSEDDSEEAAEGLARAKRIVRTHLRTTPVVDSVEMEMFQKILDHKGDHGNRDSARVQLQARFPQVDITFEDRKISDMIGRDGDKPAYSDEYLRACGFQLEY